MADFPPEISKIIARHYHRPTRHTSCLNFRFPKDLCCDPCKIHYDLLIHDRKAKRSAAQCCESPWDERFKNHRLSSKRNMYVKAWKNINGTDKEESASVATMVTKTRSRRTIKKKVTPVVPPPQRRNVTTRPTRVPTPTVPPPKVPPPKVPPPKVPPPMVPPPMVFPPMVWQPMAWPPMAWPPRTWPPTAWPPTASQPAAWPPRPPIASLPATSLPMASPAPTVSPPAASPHSAPTPTVSPPVPIASPHTAPTPTVSPPAASPPVASPPAASTPTASLPTVSPPTASLPTAPPPAALPLAASLPMVSPPTASLPTARPSMMATPLPITTIVPTLPARRAYTRSCRNIVLRNKHVVYDVPNNYDIICKNELSRLYGIQRKYKSLQKIVARSNRKSAKKRPGNNNANFSI